MAPKTGSPFIVHSPMRLTIALPAIALLAGCGGGLMAPEGPASNAFLNQVDAACSHLSIGKQPIGYLLDVNTDDVTFLDETAKLGTGVIAPDTYRQAINSFYPTGNNQPAIDCIIAQLN